MSHSCTGWSQYITLWSPSWWHVTLWPEQDARTESKYFTNYLQHCVNQCPLKLAWTAHFLRPFLSVWCVTPWQFRDTISQHYSNSPAHDIFVTGTIVLIFQRNIFLFIADEKLWRDLWVYFVLFSLSRCVSICLTQKLTLCLPSQYPALKLLI